MHGSVAVPNLVTVPVDADGKIGLFNGSWTSPIRWSSTCSGTTPRSSTGAASCRSPRPLFDTRDAGDANVAKARSRGKSRST